MNGCHLSRRSLHSDEVPTGSCDVRHGISSVSRCNERARGREWCEVLVRSGLLHVSVFGQRSACTVLLSWHAREPIKCGRHGERSRVHRYGSSSMNASNVGAEEGRDGSVRVCARVCVSRVR